MLKYIYVLKPLLFSPPRVDGDGFWDTGMRLPGLYKEIKPDEYARVGSTVLNDAVYLDEENFKALVQGSAIVVLTESMCRLLAICDLAK